MRPRAPQLSAFAAALLILATAAPRPVAADEGMWLMTDFPERTFQQRYGFVPPPEELRHMRRTAVKIGGGSGAFVSPEGLVLTNHHVGADCIQRLSSAERNLLRDGFVAASREDELPCPQLDVHQVLAVDDVTARIRKAEGGGGEDAGEGTEQTGRAERREAEVARIEAACSEPEGETCEVVTLFGGGRYELYRYRVLTDVRLAFAPEEALANFGGEIDNFEYPRFNLDFALFRVYDDGRPFRPEEHLAWSAEGPREGEVTYLYGFPGSTRRDETHAQFAWARNVEYPFTSMYLNGLRTELLAFAARGEEERRIIAADLASVENTLKATSGYLYGLLTGDAMEAKARQEAELARRLAERPELAEKYGRPWEEIEELYEGYRTFFVRHYLLEERLPRASRLLDIAFDLVRLAAESGKPDTERLSLYRQASRERLERRLFSEAPIYPAYEEARIAAYLRVVFFQLGAAHPLVDSFLSDPALGGGSPEEVAARVVAGTRLIDIEARRRLVEAGPEAVAASDDPLIVLMRRLEPAARELEDRFQREVEEPEVDAATRLAQLRLALAGDDEIYPDATRSLRISFGRVEGYEERGEALPWRTTFPGLFARSEARGGEPPFRVTEALSAARERLDPEIPLNFTSTHDIIGGNSGSPVVNRRLELVGVVFDINRYKLPGRWTYQHDPGRSITVSAPAMVEVLSEVYPAAHLAAEMTGGGTAGAGGGKGKPPS